MLLLKTVRKTIASYLIESMHLELFISDPVSTYSSGMLKKLSLALAFIGKPRIILLDEPLITLDEDAICVLYQWIDEKNKKEGTSFFLSSHQSLDSTILQKAQVLTVEQKTIKSAF